MQLNKRKKIKTFVSSLRLRMLAIAYSFRSHALLSPYELFVRDGYNKRLLKGLPLTGDSVCLDFGGYLGDFTNELLDKFGCHISVFEPVSKFNALLRERFKYESKIVVHDFGVGLVDGTRFFHDAADGSGLFSDGETLTVQFKSAEYLARLFPNTEIDLIAMNIEGGEYELISALWQSKFFERTNYLLIQFHKISEESEIMRDVSRKIMEKTHTQIWNYDFIWECWKRN